MKGERQLPVSTAPRGETPYDRLISAICSEGARCYAQISPPEAQMVARSYRLEIWAVPQKEARTRMVVIQKWSDGKFDYYLSGDKYKTDESIADILGSSEKTNDVDALLESSATSYWLKDAIKAAFNRDVVDALHDAEVLVDVLRLRYAECV